MPEKQKTQLITSNVGLRPVSERKLDDIKRLRRQDGASHTSTSSRALVAEAIAALHAATFEE